MKNDKKQKKNFEVRKNNKNKQKNRPRNVYEEGEVGEAEQCIEITVKYMQEKTGRPRHASLAARLGSVQFPAAPSYRETPTVLLHSEIIHI